MSAHPHQTGVGGRLPFRPCGNQGRALLYRSWSGTPLRQSESSHKKARRQS